MKRKISKTGKDKKILKGLARKDSKTLHQIYDLYFSMIERMVLSNSGNKEAAEDLFQEALIVLYNKANDKDFILTSQLQTYLYAICKKLWSKKLRQQKRHPIDAYNQEGETPPEIEQDIEDHQSEKLQIDKLNRALKNLGSPCKELLEGFYIQNYSMKELAEKFQYTNASNAKTQKYKCLQRLKKIFFKQEAKDKKDE